MRLTLDVLRQVISEVVEDTDSPNKDELSLTSVDNQIDSILIGFESESMSEKGLSEEFSLLTLRDLLLEQEDLDTPEEEPEKEVTDSSARSEEEPADPSAPALDVDEFVSKVGRLILNYDNLLDIPSVIINRAKNYLSSSGYGDEIIESFQDELFDRFGPELGADFDGPSAPIAAGAGPLGGGAA